MLEHSVEPEPIIPSAKAPKLVFKGPEGQELIVTEVSACQLENNWIEKNRLEALPIVIGESNFNVPFSNVAWLKKNNSGQLQVQTVETPTGTIKDVVMRSGYHLCGQTKYGRFRYP